MADANIRIDTQVIGDQRYFKASVEPGSDLPTSIWLYENTGTDQLGDWYGVADLNELTTTQEFTGTAIPTFGNKYVRYAYAELFLPYNADQDKLIEGILRSVSLLRTEYLAGSGGTSILYPVP